MGQVGSRISGYFSDKNDGKDEIQGQDYPSRSGINSAYVRKKVKYTRSHNDCADLSITPSVSFDCCATPRNPLKRVRQISPVTTIPQSILDIFSPTKKIRIDEFLDFPFLCDQETVGYYRKSKVFIILRGLPGSGKSTIAKHIQRKYVSSKVFSADHFFMKDGKYVYDRSLIKDAHLQCQKNSVESVQEQTPVIVIDNTNLKLWEMKFYLDLANEFNYVSVIVEPQTPWGRELAALVSKNTHSIDEEIMSWKISDYEEINPIYYGWFLNERDSSTIAEHAEGWIEYAYEFEEFKKDFQNRTQEKSLQGLLDFFKKTSQSHILHCTSKYIGKQDTLENQKYIDDTQRDVGRAFDIEIVGFVLTPRTFGARLKLSDEQIILWCKNDTEEVPSHFFDSEDQTIENQENEMDVDLTNGLNGDDHGLKNGSYVETNGCDLYSNDLKSKCAETADSSATLSADNHDLSSTTENRSSHHVTFDETNKEVNSVPDTSDELHTNGVSNTNVQNTLCDDKSVPDTSLTLNIEDTIPNKPISPSKNRSNKFDKKYPKKQKGGTSIPKNMLDIKDSFVRGTCTAIDAELNNFTPTQGKGSRAHFTLGCAPGIKAVTTGLDLILAVQKEREHQEGINSEISLDNGASPLLNYTSKRRTLNGNFSETSFPSISGEGVAIHNYGDGVWVFYLEEKLVVKSLFTAVL